MPEAIILIILIVLLLVACVVLVAKLLRANGKLSLFEKLEADKLAVETQLESLRKSLGEAETSIARLQERANEKELTHQTEQARWEADREKFGHEKADLEKQVETERVKSSDLAVELANLKGARESALTKNSELEQVVSDQKQQIANKAADLEGERQKNSKLAIDFATLQSEYKSAQEKIQTHQADKNLWEADREKFSHDKTNLEKQLEAERTKSSNLAVEIANAKGALDSAMTRNSELVQNITDQKQQIAVKNADLEDERQKNSKLAIDFATLQSERNTAQDQLRRYQQEEKSRSELVRAEIENLSNKIFEEKSGKFKEIGTTAIADLVTPVRENLERLQKALTESETKDAVREQSLREAIERVGEINAHLGQQADNLAKALRSDNKLIGDFGEEILERILEFSGLQSGVHFIEQGADLSLKDENGRHLKPDIVILLPENRCLVVDSKTSLKHWVDVQTEDASVQNLARDAFMKSIRQHIDDLAARPYTESLNAMGKMTVDFKFMFIPIEGAFHACLQLDRGLYQYAFDRKIILVSPTTLLAVLTTVNHTWKQFEIGKNAEAIRSRAGHLLSKLNDFCATMLKVGENLTKAQDSYEGALKKLSKGNGNLVRQAQMLQDLKVDSTKQIPVALLDIASDEDEE